jgi:hypothetical protein
MSAIAFYYCCLELDLDYKSLSRKSQEIGTSNNGFIWMGWDKKLCGIIGSWTFYGNLDQFQSMLLIGEYLHAGKGAACGLGRYHLEKAG